MTEEKIWDFDDKADIYDQWVKEDKRLFAFYDEVLQKVKELASPKPGKKILDIGTGTGNLLFRLKNLTHIPGLSGQENLSNPLPVVARMKIPKKTDKICLGNLCTSSVHSLYGCRGY